MPTLTAPPPASGQGAGPDAGSPKDLRRRAAAQLEREAGWLKELTRALDTVGVAAGSGNGRRAGPGAAGAPVEDPLRRARRRLATATRNLESHLSTAERALAASPDPDPSLVRAVLVVREAIREAVRAKGTSHLHVPGGSLPGRDQARGRTAQR